MKTRRITGRYDPVALRAVLRSQPKISCAPGEGLDILLSTPVALYALTPSEYKDAVFPLVKTDPGTWTRLRSGEMKQDTVPYSALSILRDTASKTADEPVLEKGPLRLACGKTLLRPFHHPKNGFIVWINDALILPLADAEIELRGTGPKMPVAAFDRGRQTTGPRRSMMPDAWKTKWQQNYGTNPRKTVRSETDRLYHSGIKAPSSAFCFAIPAETPPARR